jgi:hypothetical protein
MNDLDLSTAFSVQLGLESDENTKTSDTHSQQSVRLDYQSV